MTQKEMTDILTAQANKMFALEAELSGEIRALIVEAAKKLIEVGYSMPDKGKQFVFGDNKKVNEILNSLYIAIYNLIYDYAKREVKITDEVANNLGITPNSDRTEEFFALLFNGRTLQERIEDELQKFANEVEAYVAVGRFNGLSKEGTANTYLQNIRAPQQSTIILAAIGVGFLAQFANSIRRPGRGRLNSSLRSLERIGEDMMLYNYARLNRENFTRKFKRKMIITMGDDLVCGACDDAAMQTYSIEEDVVPLHGNCRCIEVPIAS